MQCPQRPQTARLPVAKTMDTRQPWAEGIFRKSQHRRNRRQLLVLTEIPGRAEIPPRTGRENGIEAATHHLVQLTMRTAGCPGEEVAARPLFARQCNQTAPEFGRKTGRLTAAKTGNTGVDQDGQACMPP